MASRFTCSFSVAGVCLCLLGPERLPAASAEPVSVTFAGPQGPLAERPGAVTLVFSRPMQPLQATTESLSEVATVTRSHDQATLAGTWVWYGAQTAVFYFKEPLASATTYQVHVPRTSQAIDGTQLAQPLAYTFSTPLPKLLTAELDPAEPHKGYAVDVTFNQSVTPTEVMRAVEVSGNRRGHTRVVPFTLKGNAQARTDFHLLLDASANSVDDAKLTVRADLRSTEGPLASQQRAEFPLPRLATLSAKLNCDRNLVGSCKTFGSPIILSFNKDVSRRELFEKAQFEPRIVLPQEELEGETDTLSLEKLFAFAAPPEGRYLISFPRGLTAMDGEQAPPMRFEFNLAEGDSVVEFDGQDGSNVLSREDFGLRYIAQTDLSLAAAPLGRSEYFTWLGRDPRSFTETRYLGGTAIQEVPLAAGTSSHGHVALPNRLWPGGDPGAVLFSVKGAGVEATRLVTSTDLGITTSVGPQGGKAWVTRLSNAQPVPGAKVTLREQNELPVRFVGTTDQRGVVDFPAAALKSYLNGPVSSPKPLVVAELGKEWTYDILAPMSSRALEPFMTGFTERSLYQPGEDVHVRAYYRYPVLGGYRTPVGERVEVTLLGPDERVLSHSWVTLDSHGSLYTKLTLPKDMPLGRARVLARIHHELAKAKPVGWFDVSRYRVVDIKAEGNLDRHDYVNGDEAKFTLNAETLHGTPLFAAKAKWKVTASPESHYAPTGYSGFHFSDSAVDQPATLDDFESLLDSKGSAERRIRLAPPRQSVAMKLEFEASVGELEGQLAVGAWQSAILHPASFDVGIKVFANDNVFVVREPLKAEVVAVPVTPLDPNQTLTVNFYRDPKPEDDDSSFASATKVSDATTPSHGTVEFVPQEPGQYYARVTGTDLKGRTTAAVTPFFVLAARPKGEKAEKPRTSRVEEPPLLPPMDREQFVSWCKALPKGPFAVIQPAGTGAYVLPVGVVRDYCVRTPANGRLSVALEQAGVLQQRFFETRPGGSPVAQKLPRSAYPAARVAMHWVTAVTQEQPLGYQEWDTEYDLIDPSRTLDVELRGTSPFSPGSRGQLEVMVSRQGRPAAAQVTLWAVDQGVVSQSRYRAPSPQSDRDNDGRVAVATSDSRKRIFRPGHRFTRPPTVAWGNTTVEPRDPFAIRDDFPAVAWYLPNVMLDGSGRLKLSLPLPDNATTWHVYAVAAGTDDSFGTDEYLLQTSQPIVIRPKVPRFTRLGDRYEARFTVDTKLQTNRQARIELLATGAATGQHVALLSLPRQGMVQVGLPVVTTKVGRATLTARLDADNDHDALRVTHEVAPVTTLETTALGDTVHASASYPFVIPENVDPTQGGLEILLDNRNAPALAPAREWIARYPYACTEQLASQLLARMGTIHRALSKTEQEGAQATLLELLVRQRTDGGFGYWPSSATSDPVLSIHVLRSLLTAKRMNLDVPDSRVTATLRQLDQAILDINQQAQLEALLAEAGQARSSKLASLLGKPESLDAFARGLLAFAVARHSAPQARTLLPSLLSTVVVAGTTAVVPATCASGCELFASTARSTASVLRALVAIEPEHPFVEKLVSGLLALRRGDHWATTSDNLWATLALAEFGQKEPQADRLSGQLTWGGAEVWRAGSDNTEARVFVPMQQLLKAKSRSLNFLRTTGSVHFQAFLRSATPQSTTKAVHRGFSVERILRLADSKSVPVATKLFPLGSYVSLDVLVQSPVPREQVLIEAPLPAGLEAVDEALALTPHLTLPSLGPVTTPTRIELREDRVVFFMDRLPAGSYQFSQLLRATTRGTFLAPAARAEALYAPDVFGHSASATVEVK